MSGKCEQCGTTLAETGAPIWESYCPNTECDFERKRLLAGVRAIRDRREREEYERLKAKFEPASVDTRPEGGDSTKIEAPFTGGAVPEGQTPKGPPQ